MKRHLLPPYPYPYDMWLYSYNENTCSAPYPQSWGSNRLSPPGLGAGGPRAVQLQRKQKPVVQTGQRVSCVPPTGLEPVLLAPEASALSTELRGQVKSFVMFIYNTGRALLANLT
jgi:hypothetical protein